MLKKMGSGLGAGGAITPRVSSDTKGFLPRVDEF